MLDSSKWLSNIWLSVGASGFEPPTSWSRTRRANRAALRPAVAPKPRSRPTRKKARRGLAASTSRPYFHGTRSMLPDAVVRTRRSRRTAICAVGAAALLQGGWACRRAATAAPPPPEVSVLTVAPETVSARFEFVGQAAASRRVEVRAQVAGVIIARPYAEGTDVPKGALLFQIDSTTYDAAYRSARAQLADAAARLANADRNSVRLKALLGSRAVAQKDVDDAETASDQARAAVQAAQAAVDRAKKDYDDTFVRAEIAGRAGRASDTRRRQHVSRYRPAEFHRPRLAAADGDPLAPRGVPQSAARVVAGPVRAATVRGPQAAERDPRAPAGRPAGSRRSVRLRGGGQQQGGGAACGSDVLGPGVVVDRAGPPSGRPRGGGRCPEGRTWTTRHAGGVPTRSRLERRGGEGQRPDRGAVGSAEDQGLPVSDAPRRTRTPSLLIRSQALYPVELWARVGGTRLELVTSTMSTWRSNQLS